MNIMKKRGVIGQPFIYIFAVIVIALVFMFGFKMITKLGDLNQQTVFLTFKSDLRKNVDEVYYKNVGTVLVFSKDSRNKPLLLPKEVEEVCFEDSNVTPYPLDYFTVDYLLGNECIEAQNNELSFRLENVVIGGETYVEISLIE